MYKGAVTLPGTPKKKRGDPKLENYPTEESGSAGRVRRFRASWGLGSINSRPHLLLMIETLHSLKDPKTMGILVYSL